MGVRPLVSWNHSQECKNLSEESSLDCVRAAGKHHPGVHSASSSFALHRVKYTTPRRVYTQSQMDYLIEVVQEVCEKRHELRGMRFIREPKVLRHFTGRFDYVDT
jgi:tryptophanase